MRRRRTFQPRFFLIFVGESKRMARSKSRSRSRTNRRTKSRYNRKTQRKTHRRSKLRLRSKSRSNRKTQRTRRRSRSVYRGRVWGPLKRSVSTAWRKARGTPKKPVDYISECAVKKGCSKDRLINAYEKAKKICGGTRECPGSRTNALFYRAMQNNYYE